MRKLPAELGGGGQADFGPTKTLETPIQGIAKGSLVAGKYRIIEEIGRGGMGIVYKAEDTKLKRTVALKFLPHQWTADAAARERFIHEARAASALDHPNICNIHEIEETEDGRMYIFMAYYEGESLKEKIKREPLKTEEAVSIASQVAQGMTKAHQKGIVHRDLKPANILITNDSVAKIVDFGLAKLAGQVKLTREGTTVGTVAYMSPEQARGDAVDQRTDIWSLGVVLYEMLSSRLPFKGDYEQSLIHSILKTEPEPITKFRKDLPTGLAQIIAKALAKNPASRYQTIDELVEDLNAIAEGLKPVRAKMGFFRGRIFGLKKTYAFAALSAIILLAALVFLFFSPNRGQVYDSLAVLPLVNLSGDPAQDYFSDGMHDALITELSKIKAISVTSRTSMMGYQGTKKPVREIAKELGVATIVEGSTIRSGNTARINVQLIDGRTDRHLWADTFDREYRDVLILLSEVALAIAQKIRAQLTPEETKILSSKRQVNQDAYDACLKGMNFISLASINNQELEKCFPHFERALKIDPDFTRAYAGLAIAYDMQYGFALASPKDVVPKSKRAAEKALSLDHSLVDAQYELAGWAWYPDYDIDLYIKEMRLFVERNSNHALGHAGLALCLAQTGRGRKEEVIQHAAIARKLDPMSYSMAEYLAEGAYSPIQEFDRAILLAKDLVMLYPNDPSPHLMISRYSAYKRNKKEAWSELQKAMDLGYKPDSFMYASYYAWFGDETKARKYLNDFLTQSSKEIQGPRYVVSYAMARIYALLKEKEKAFEWLSVAWEEKCAALWFLKTDMAFNNLRGDPRYLELLKKMHLDK